MISKTASLLLNWRLGLVLAAAIATYGIFVIFLTDDTGANQTNQELAKQNFDGITVETAGELAGFTPVGRNVVSDLLQPKVVAALEVYSGGPWIIRQTFVDPDSRGGIAIWEDGGSFELGGASDEIDLGPITGVLQDDSVDGGSSGSAVIFFPAEDRGVFLYADLDGVVDLDFFKATARKIAIDVLR